MKEFRKNEQGFFVCEECGKICTKNKLSLSIHIKQYHNINNRTYYDKWIKETNEGVCKICNKETEFIGFKGYKNCCSKKCIYDRIKKSNLENYGVENQFQRKYTKEKSKQTKREKYGNENYVNREKTNKTNLKKYGNISACNGEEQNKMKKDTWIKNYGVENPSKSKEIKKQKEITCLKHFGVKAGFADVKKRNLTNKDKYGVEYPMQNIEIFNKSFKTRILIHQYKDADVTYQGSYELNFLELCERLEILDKIQNVPSIKYKLDSKEKVYHSDFYISYLNLVVEIKSSWTLQQNEKEIMAKKKATFKSGYNYLMILNKNYNKFLEITKI